MALGVAYLLETNPYNPATGQLERVCFALNLPDDAALGQAVPYAVRLKQAFTHETSVFDQNVPGGTQISVGSSTINNADGAYDYLLRYNWDAREVTVRRGYSGAPYASYTVEFTGSTLELNADGVDLVLTLRDNSWRLARPVQQNTYAGTGGAEGPPDMRGRRKPLLAGLARNLEPVLLDEVRLTGQVHDGAVTAFQQVYDRGVPLTQGGDHATYAALVAATVAPGSYATCRAGGYFKLGAKPVGTLTMDVVAGSYVTLPDAALAVLTGVGGFPASLVNAASFTQAATEVPYAYEGLYYSEPDFQVDEFLETVTSAINGMWFFNRAGLLTLRQFRFRASTSTIRAEDVTNLQRNSSPGELYRVKTAYARNMTVQAPEDFTLPRQTLNGYLTDNALYFVHNADGSGGNYAGYTGTFNVFLNATQVNDLGNVLFQSNVPWVTMNPDGTFKVSNPGADTALATLTANLGEFTVSQQLLVYRTYQPNPKSLALTTNLRRFYYDANNAPSPAGQTATVNLSPLGGATPYTWTATDNLGNAVALGGTGNSRTLGIGSLVNSLLVATVTVRVQDAAGSYVFLDFVVQHGDDGYAAGVLAGLTSGGDGGVDVFYQNSAPSPAEADDLWFDLDDSNKLYRYTGSAWVEIADSRIADALTAAAGAQGTADGKITTYLSEPAPAGTTAKPLAVGDLWYRPSTKVLSRWDGTAWSNPVATYGATSGSTVFNSGGGVMGDLNLDNKFNQTGAQSTGSKFFNQSFDAVDGNGAPLGVMVQTYTPYDFPAPASVLGWEGGTGGDLVVGTGATPLNLYLPMYRLNVKSKYRVRAEVKALTAGAPLSMYFTESDVEQSSGVQYLAFNTGASTNVPATVAGFTRRTLGAATLTGGDGVNNVALTTSYQQVLVEYTPTATAKFGGLWISRSAGAANGLVFRNVVIEEIAPTSLSQLDSASAATLAVALAADLTPPAVPSGLVLSSNVRLDTDGSQVVNLIATWNAVGDSDLAGYALALKETATGNYVEFDLGPSTTRYERTVPANVVFVGKVRAYDKQRNFSAYTAEVPHTTLRDTTPPAVPTGLTGTASFQSIFLSWLNPDDADLTNVTVYENTTDNSATATVLQQVNATPGSRGSATRSGLSSSGTRYYWLKAVDSSGNASGFSNSVALTLATVSGADITDFTIPGGKISPLTTLAETIRVQGAGVPGVNDTLADAFKRANYSTVSGTPTSLGQINTVEGVKFAGISFGATAAHALSYSGSATAANLLIAGNTVTKVAGADVYADGTAGETSADSVTLSGAIRGGCRASANPLISSQLSMGLASGNNYRPNGMDWSLRTRADRGIELYSGGTLLAAFPAAAVDGNSLLEITYDQVKVRFLHNGTLLGEYDAAADKNYYLNVHFKSVGSELRRIAFEPFGNQLPANSALLSLSRIQSDGWLTASEKPELVRHYNQAKSLHDSLRAKAINLGAYVTERDAAQAALTVLTDYLTALTPVWTDTATDTVIPTPATFKSNWDNLYARLAELEAAITGQPGSNSAVVTLFIRSTATPTSPSGSFTYNFATGAFTGDSGSNLNGWSQTTPATNGQPMWAIQTLYSSPNPTQSKAPTWGPARQVLVDGAAGAASISGVLTNEDHTVATASDGTGADFTGAGGTFQIYEGLLNRTGAGPAYSVVAPATVSGLTMTINAATGVYSLAGTSWTSDRASFTLQATYSGATVQKSYTITKAKAGSGGGTGPQGPIGPAGAGAKLIYLNSDVQTVSYDSAGVVQTPAQQINFTRFYQNTTGNTRVTITRLDGTALDPRTYIFAPDGFAEATATYIDLTNAQRFHLTNATFDAARGATNGVIVIVTCDGVSDRISVIRVQAGAAGANVWTPISSNLTRDGNRFTKTGGVNTLWDAGVHSVEKVVGAVVTVSNPTSGQHLMFGLTTADQAADYNFTNITHCAYLNATGPIQPYVSGTAQTATGSTWASTDTISVEHRGAAVVIVKNGAVIYTFPAAVSPTQAFALDSSFWGTGSAMNLALTTRGANTFDEIGGANKPKDYAGQILDESGQRSVVQPPSYYYALGRGERQEFKDQGFAGTNAAGYCHLLTVTQYQDASGGPVKQTLTNSNYEIYERYSLSATTWSAWTRNYNGAYKPRLGEDLLTQSGQMLTELMALNANQQWGQVNNAPNQKINASNLLELKNWRHGVDLGTAALPLDATNTYYPVQRNGAATGASVITNKIGPSGVLEPVLVSTGKGGFGDGGVNFMAGPTEGFDPKKSYRMTVWVQVPTESVYNSDQIGFYVGTGNSAGASGAGDAYSLPVYAATAAATADGNAYFWEGGAFSTANGNTNAKNKWLLGVFHMHGCDSTALNSGVSGWYDPVTGQKLSSATEWRWHPSATRGGFRFFSYNPNLSVFHWFARPTFEEVRGDSTLSVAQLLSTPGAPTGTMVGGTLSQTVETRANDPATRINQHTVTVDGGKLTAASVDTAQLKADAVTANKIAALAISARNIQAFTITAGELAANSVTAIKIAASTITGDKIAANTIRTSNLLVTGEGSALNDDPMFYDSTAWYNAGGADHQFVTVTDGVAGNTALATLGENSYVRSSRLVPINRNKTYRVSIWARSKTANLQGTFFGLDYKTSTGNQAAGAGGNMYVYFAIVLIPTTWTRYEFEFGFGTSQPFGADVAFVQPGFLGGLAAPGDGAYYQDFRIEEKMPASLIVKGGILADNLAVGAVTADKILAGAVIAGKLAADSVVALNIVGGTITGDKIQANTIEGGSIKTNTSLPGTVTVGNTGVTIDTVRARAYDTSTNVLTLIGNTAAYTMSGNSMRQTAAAAGAGYWGGPMGTLQRGSAYVSSSVTLSDGVYTMLGLDDDATSVTHPNITYFLHALYSGNGTISMTLYNGAPGYAVPGTHAVNPDSRLRLQYDGLQAQVLLNGVVLLSIAATAGQNLYPKVITYNGSGTDGVRDIQYGSLMDNSLSGADPAARINAYTTNITPGKILIQGSTTLDSWRDATEIRGGAIKTNSISAEKIALNARGISVIGCDFRYEGGRLHWSDGYVLYTADNGLPSSPNISAGSVAWGGGSFNYIFWDKGATTFRQGVDNWEAAQSANSTSVIMCTWRNGSNFVANYGGTILSGDRIVTGSIAADRLAVTSLSAITANIGSLVSYNGAGGRVERDGNGTRVYGNNGVLRVKIGF